MRFNGTRSSLCDQRRVEIEYNLCCEAKQSKTSRLTKMTKNENDHEHPKKLGSGSERYK